jgi:DNA-binding protein Fis
MTPKIYYVCKSRDPKVIKQRLEEIHHKAGTKAKAAKKIGISKWTLYQWYARYNVDVPTEYPKSRPWSRKKRGYYLDLDAIKQRLGFVNMRSMINYCDKNYTYLEAADVLGISTGTYQKMRKEYGLMRG